MAYPITHTLTNPGAETGDTTGWTDEVGALDACDTGQGAHTGSYYFDGGTSSEVQSSQEVDLVSDGVSTTDIDNGILAFDVEWWQASYEVADQGAIILRFKDASRATILEVSSGLVASSPAQTWISREFIKRIPADSRYVDIVLHCYRTGGTNNNAGFDDIVCTTQEISTTPDSYPIDHALINPGGEFGTTGGWVDEEGALGLKTISPAPYAGSYYLYGGPNAVTKASQEIDLVLDRVDTSDIDAASLRFVVSWQQASYDAYDSGEIRLRFKDASRATISEVGSGLTVVSPGQVWESQSFIASIPANTRYVDVIIHGNRNYGANCAAYFDDIACYTEETPEVPSSGSARPIVFIVC